MFQAEESLQHLQAMRYQVIALKEGQKVEELPSLDMEKEKNLTILSKKQKQKEINE